MQSRGRQKSLVVSGYKHNHGCQEGASINSTPGDILSRQHSLSSLRHHYKIATTRTIQEHRFQDSIHSLSFARRDQTVTRLPPCQLLENTLYTCFSFPVSLLCFSFASSHCVFVSSFVRPDAFIEHLANHFFPILRESSIQAQEDKSRKKKPHPSVSILTLHRPVRFE